jgi:hypothetical protein
VDALRISAPRRAALPLGPGKQTRWPPIVRRIPLFPMAQQGSSSVSAPPAGSAGNSAPLGSSAAAPLSGHEDKKVGGGSTPAPAAAGGQAEQEIAIDTSRLEKQGGSGSSWVPPADGHPPAAILALSGLLGGLHPAAALLSQASPAGPAPRTPQRAQRSAPREEEDGEAGGGEDGGREAKLGIHYSPQHMASVAAYGSTREQNLADYCELYHQLLDSETIRDLDVQLLRSIVLSGTREHSAEVHRDVIHGLLAVIDSSLESWNELSGDEGEDAAEDEADEPDEPEDPRDVTPEPRPAAPAPQSHPSHSQAQPAAHSHYAHAAISQPPHAHAVHGTHAARVAEAPRVSLRSQPVYATNPNPYDAPPQAPEPPRAPPRTREVIGTHYSVHTVTSRPRARPMRR